MLVIKHIYPLYATVPVDVVVNADDILVNRQRRRHDRSFRTARPRGTK